MQKDQPRLLELISAGVLPESGHSLAELGILAGATTESDGTVTVTIREALPRRSPDPRLRAAIEAQLRPQNLVLGKIQTSLETTARQISEDDPVPEVHNVILVMSGKGGVGKSTVCANLAVALSQMGARVGLLDADIYGPSVPTLFGVQSQPVSDGEGILPIERFGIKLMSIGFLLEDSRSAVIWRGPMLHGALLQFLKDVKWGKLDYLLLDLPPGTGDIALTLSQRIAANGAVVVTTPQEVALQDVYKAVAMNNKVGITNLGVIENQSYFVCSACGTQHDIYGSGGGQKVADMSGAPLLGQLPMDPLVQKCSDAGTPVVMAVPDSEVSGKYFALAERLAARVDEENRSAGADLVIDRSGGQNRHLPVARP